MGHLGGSAVGCLPSAQVVILESRIGSHIGLPVRSQLLPLPMSLSLSVCFSWINKKNLKRKKQKKPNPCFVYKMRRKDGFLWFKFQTCFDSITLLVIFFPVYIQFLSPVSLYKGYCCNFSVTTVSAKTQCKCISNYLDHKMDGVCLDVLTNPWREISVKAISPQAFAFLIIWIKATSAHLLFRNGQLYLLVCGLSC